MTRKSVLGVLLALLAGVTQAGLTGEFLFNGSAFDTSPTGATLTPGSGAAVSTTNGVMFNGSATAYVKAVAPSNAWDGKYWSNANSSFTLTWDLDINTAQVSTATNGAGLLTFTNTALAGGTTHIKGNKILGMDAAGKLFIAANSIANDSGGNATTAYKTAASVNNGQPHHIQVIWDIKPDTITDTVTIKIDGISQLIVTGFDFNAAAISGDFGTWTAPGMLLGQNIKAGFWESYNGWMDNVSINFFPASSASINAGEIIENFDLYQNSTELRAQWGAAGSGAAVALNTYSSVELSYSNLNSPWSSQAQRSFSPSLNFLSSGYQAVAVDIQGNTQNANQPLYLILGDGTAGVQIQCLIADCLINESWQTWIIPLSRFAGEGLNLSSVQTIGFKIGNGISPSGAGAILIDDIRLTSDQCVAQNAPKGDVDGNCIVNLVDLGLVAEDWLMADFSVSAAAPSASNLLAYYRFNETSGLAADDASPNNYDAAVEAGNSSGLWDSSGHADGCIYLSADRAVFLPAAVFNAVSNQVTISMWIKGNGLDFPEKCNVVEALCGLAGYEGNVWHAASWQIDSAAACGNWNHYAMTADAVDNVIKIYLNGVLVSQFAGGDVVLDGSHAGQTVIGSNVYEGIGDSWVKLDELQVYRVVLSQPEIVYLASGASSQVTQPIAPVLTLADIDPSGKIDLADFAKVASDWLLEKWWN